MSKTILNSFKALGKIFGREKKSPSRKTHNKTTKNNKWKVQNKKPEPSERFFKSSEEVENTPIKSTTPSLTPLRAPRPEPGTGDKAATQKAIERERRNGTRNDNQRTITPRETQPQLSNLELEKIFDDVELQHLNETIHTSKFTEKDLDDYKKRLDGSDFGLVSAAQRDAGVTMILGLDFGSTCSKAVIRFPYETISEKPEAVPAIECMAVQNNPYYWKSEIFLKHSGSFSLLPNDAVQSFTDLKMDFIKRAEGGEKDVSDKDVPLIAYLTLMIQQALGWAKDKHPNYSKEDVQVEINFGFPTKSFEKSFSLLKYKKTINIVIKLVEDQKEISFSGIKNQIDQCKNKEIQVKTPTEIVPEIVAAVTGFANSNESRLGNYIVIDIGGLSIDYAFFSIRSYPDSGEINFGISAAGSKKHGVEILKNSGRTDEEMSRVLYMNITATLKEAYSRLRYKGIEWTGTKIPVFLTGGGRKLKAYKDAIRITNMLLGGKVVYYRECEIRDIHRFNGLDHSLVQDRIPNRLIVAYGLSFSDLEIPDWYTPDQHLPIEQVKELEFTTAYIGPEQV